MPVAHLQNIQVSVAGTDTDDIGNAARLACGSAHPQNIVVAPLDVHGVVAHELVHDLVRARASVEDISHDM